MPTATPPGYAVAAPQPAENNLHGTDFLISEAGGLRAARLFWYYCAQVIMWVSYNAK